MKDSTRNRRSAGLRVAAMVAAAVSAALAPHAAAQQEGAGPVAQSAPAATAQRPAVMLDIPAQPLDSALTILAERTGLTMLFTSATVAGLRSTGISGQYRPENALSLMLSGTGLTFRPAGIDAVTIEAPGTGSGPRELPQLTVLGSRQPIVPISNVPAAITFVDREQIQRQLATTNRIEDVLTREVPGFNPTNNGVRQIRGRTAQVFINGVPVNEQLRASSGSDLNLLSPDQLADIEVSRGANSAYGFGSPGGIIALQTPRAESEALVLRTVVRESLNPGHVSGSHQASLYQSAAQIIGNADFHIGGSLAYDGDSFDPDGNLSLGFDNSALLTNGTEVLTNLDGSFGLDLGENGRLRLTGTFGHVDFRSRYSVTPGTYRQQYGTMTKQPRGGESFRRSYTANLSYENDHVLGSALKLEAFASNTYTEVHSTSAGTNFRDEQSNSYLGLRSAITTPLDALHAGTSVTYGLDLLRNRYFRPYYNDDTGALSTYFSPDVTLDSFAPYAQLSIPLGAVTLSGGLRREEYRGHVKTAIGPGGISGGDIQGFGLTLFNAGLVYSLTDAVELYSSFSQGAEITQLGRAARSATSADQVDPQPAKSDQFEIGMRGDWAGLSTGLASFYTQSKKLSALQCDGINPCTPLREPRRFWGIEGSLDWRIDHRWGTGGILTWQDGVRETAAGDVRRIDSRAMPPLLATLYLDYSPFDWWRSRLQLNYRGNRDPFGDSMALGEGRVDRLLLVDLSSGFDVGPGEFRVGVSNLLNTTYTSIPAEAGNAGFIWVPEQGRRVYLSYALRW